MNHSKLSKRATAASDMPVEDALAVLSDLMKAGLYDRLKLDERLYVALVTERADLLRDEGFSVMEAFAMLPDAWAGRIYRRWSDQANDALGHAEATSDVRPAPTKLPLAPKKLH
jgi:hypothetical protein